MTWQEFEREYAEASGVTIEYLKEQGREVRPCDCGEEGCYGWQMAHIRLAEEAVAGGYALPRERELLEWSKPT